MKFEPINPEPPVTSSFNSWSPQLLFRFDGSDAKPLCPPGPSRFGRGMDSSQSKNSRSSENRGSCLSLSETIAASWEIGQGIAKSGSAQNSPQSFSRE